MYIHHITCDIYHNICFKFMMGICLWIPDYISTEEITLRATNVKNKLSDVTRTRFTFLVDYVMNNWGVCGILPQKSCNTPFNTYFDSIMRSNNWSCSKTAKQNWNWCHRYIQTHSFVDGLWNKLRTTNKFPGTLEFWNWTNILVVVAYFLFTNIFL